MYVGESLARGELFLFLITISQNFNLESLVVLKDMTLLELPAHLCLQGPCHYSPEEKPECVAAVWSVVPSL